MIRDTRLKGVYGRYIYGDYCTGYLWTAALRAGTLKARVYGRLSMRMGSLSSFGQDLAGRIYLTSMDGTVARLDPAP